MLSTYSNTWTLFPLSMQLLQQHTAGHYSNLIKHVTGKHN